MNDGAASANEGPASGSEAAIREAAAAERFRLGLGLSPLLARLLAARGWSETAALTEFLYPRLEHTHSPWLMLGMRPAVTRILAAIAAGQSIRILGDYDADGTLATVILRQALQALGAQVSYHLPQRLEEGYGLRPAVIEAAVADGVGLAITVDTGIRETEPLALARSLGLDVIVTDHHLPPAALPQAFAILNPHQADCGYPDKGLCGSSVAFKLAQALLETSGKIEGLWPPALRSYLKLVALATVADSVPLLGENRVLVRFGLQGLSQPVNPGLRALLAAAVPPVPGRPSAPVSSADVAFRIAPRINAAGRMGAADQVVELFFAPSTETAARAQALDALNLSRQEICARIQAEIELRLAQSPPGPPPPILMMAGEGWHRGVLGIVASRLLARTGKPVVVISIEADHAHGSGRAPAGFSLLERIEGCAALFDRFGGHAQAVGFSLPVSRLDLLRAHLECELPAAAPPPAPSAFEISLRDVTLPFARELGRLEPFGEANPEPRFRTRGVRLAAPPMVLKERHLKLTLEHDGARHTALCWNALRDRAQACAQLANGGMLEVEYRLEANSHPQYGDRVQLILTDFIVTGLQAAESYLTAETSL